MNEFDDLIKELTAAGASDEEITAIIQEQLSKRGSAQPAQSGYYKPKTFLGRLGEPLGIPVEQEFVPGDVRDAPGVIDDRTPVGALLTGLSSSAGSVVTDLLPQTVSTLRLKGTSARAKEYEHMAQYYQSVGDVERANKFLSEASRLRAKQPGLEQDISLQKEEAQGKLSQNTQNLEDITDARSFASWLGNSIGQAAGQIPLSVVTLGSSSALMEAATIYDQQLDLLAEKHGMSREDIVKNNLDKPAEGEALAALAGALDFASAGVVMNFFKSAAKKEVKKGVLKKLGESLIGASGEAVTEGTQGILEDVGAAQGAGTEYNVDWGKFLNEAAAGFVGGGALNVASQDPNSTKVERTQRDQQVDLDTALEDKELEKQIDDIISPAADIVNKFLDGVEGAKNLKAQELIKSAEDAVIAAKQEQQRAQNEAREAIQKEDQVRFAADMLRQFESMPVVSTAPYEEAELEDTSKLPAIPQPVTQPILTPTVPDAIQEPSTETVDVLQPPSVSETVGITQPEEQKPTKKEKTKYEVDLESMSNEAVLDEISSLEEDESERSKAQLVLAKAEAKSRKISIEKQQEKAIARKEKELEVHASKAVALKSSIVKIGKIEKSASIGRFENVVEKATKLYEKTQYEPFLEVAKEAAKAQEVLIDKIEKRKQEATESKELAEKRKAEVKTKEERKAEKEQKKLEKEKKIAESPASKEVKVKAYPKIGREFSTERTAKLGEVKEQFYTEVARAQELGLGNKVINEVVDAYFEFRKENNLPMTVQGKPLTKELILQKASTRRASIVKERQKEKERQNKQRDKSQINEIKKALSEELGVKPEEIDGLGFSDFKATGKIQVGQAKFTNYVAESVRELIGSFNRERMYKISSDDLIRRIKQMPSDFRNEASLKIIKQLESLSKKRGKPLDIVLYDLPSDDSGMFIDAKNRDILILMSGVFSKEGKKSKTSGTILHELMHGKTNAIAHAAYSNVPSFSKAVNSLYDRSKVYLDTTLKVFIQAEAAKIKNTGKASQLSDLSKSGTVYRLLKYIQDFSGVKKTNELITSLGVYLTDLSRLDPKSSEYKDLLNSVSFMLINNAYGLKNQREFLSEGTSSVSFAALLHTIPSYKKFSSPKGFISVLQDLFKELRNAVVKLVGEKPFKTSFDELEFLMNTYDDLFNEDIKEEFDPKFLATTFGDLKLKDITGEEAVSAREAEIKEIINSENFIISEKKVPQDPAAKAYSKIVKGLSGLLETNPNIKSEKDVQNFVNKLNKKLDTSKQLGSEYSKDIWKQIKRDRKSLANDNKARDFYLTELKKSPEYSDVTSKYYHDIQDFEAVDISKLNRQQRGVLLTEGFSRLLNDSIISKRAYDIVLNNRVREVLDTLKKSEEKISKGWFAKQTVKWSNPMTAVTTLAKYDKNLSDVLMKNMYEKLMWAYSQSGVKANNFWHSLSTFAEKNNLTHSNLSRIGMYGAIFSTEADPAQTEAWEKEVIRNSEVAVINAKNKLQAKEEGTYTGDLRKNEIERELEIALEIYKKLEKAEQNGTLGLPSILNPKEVDLYNMIRDFAKKNEMEFFRNASAVWDQNPPMRYNYFPTMAQGRVDLEGLKSYADDQIIRSNADNIFDALTDSDKQRYNKLFGKKVGSVYRRLSPKNGYYYEFDALAIGKKWGKNLLFDTYASSELKIANRILNSNDAKKIFGVKLRDALIKQIKISAGAGLRYDHNVSQFWKTVMKVRDFSYMSMMLNTGQLVLQTSSGLAAATVMASNLNPLKAGKNFAKAVQAASGSFNNQSKFYKLLEQRGLGIQLRDAAYEKYLSPEDYRNNTKVSKLQKFSEKTSEFAITSADKFAARLVWFAAYFDAGGTMNGVSEEAVRKAERMTGLLQGISDVRWTPENFAYDSLAKKLIAGTLYAYKRFSLNAWLSFVGSIRNFNNPEARSIAAAQFGSYLAYHAATLYITRPLWSWLIQQIIGGDDDDEEKRTEKWEELLYETGWDMALGSPAPASVDQALRYFVTNSGPAQKMWKDPYEDYDQYADSPLFAPKDAEDFYKNLIGPGLKEPIGFGLTGAELMMLYSQADAYEDTEADIAKREFKKGQFVMNSIADVVGAFPLMPLRGDIRKIMRSIATERKKDYFREKRESKGGTNIDVEGSSDSIDPMYNNYMADPDSYDTPENPE